MNLLIVTGIFPPDVGGPATYLDRLTSDLHGDGWNLEIITSSSKREDRNAKEAEYPFPVHRVPKKYLTRLPTSVRLIHEKLDWADRIFVNGLEYDSTLASLFDSTPAIHKMVSDRSWERAVNQGEMIAMEEFQHRSHSWLTRLERYLQTFVARQANRIIVPSEYLKRIIVEWGIDEQAIHVIHNGAYRPGDLPDDSPEWPGKEFKILLVGRMIRLKRFPEALELLDELPGAGAVVLGDGPDRERCRSVVGELELEDQVVFKGKVPPSRVWNHLEHSDLLLMNSIHETFPHVMLEAVASGCPVVAPRVGGIPEIEKLLPEYVKLFPADDQNGLLKILRNRNFPDRFDPPEFPSPLRWETIKNQTKSVLRNINETAKA